MQTKILNYIIAFFLISILSIGGFLVYRYVTFENYSINFVLNGATSIDSDSLTCDFSLLGCIVTLPEFRRENSEIIGYNYNTSDTIARFKAGDKVLLDEDRTLYAITATTNTLTIKNDYDYIDNNNYVCKVYNDEKTCKIRTPMFNKIGYSNEGYSTNPSNRAVGVGGFVAYEYLPNEEYELNGNATLYTKYDSPNNTKYNVNYIGMDHGNFLETSKNAGSQIVNTYKKYFEEIYNNAPYLFTNIKITLFNENDFNGYWGNNYATTLGLTYAFIKSRPSKMGAIDIKYNYSKFTQSNINEENYHALVHEMVHAWDSYYPFLLKGTIPKEISKDNENNGEEYYKEYSNGRISSRNDIKNLFNKYRNSRPISNYAFHNYHEFVAEIFSYYYLKYIVPTGKYANTYYPDDIKKVVEKYICIAKNNYHSKGCV